MVSKNTPAAHNSARASAEVFGVCLLGRVRGAVFQEHIRCPRTGAASFTEFLPEWGGGGRAAPLRGVLRFLSTIRTVLLA